VITVLDKAFSAMNISPHVLKVNNRKLLHGIYAGYGLSEDARKKAITAIDKLDKIGHDGVLAELGQIEGVSQETGQSILAACNLICPATEATSRLEALGIEGELFEAGIAEMKEIFSLLPSSTLERMELNLSLARGLHYYTGIIVEAHMPQYPEYGSVGGGGRYEGLVSQFMNKEIPGVGVSIGLTRLMDLVVTNGLLQDATRFAAQVLVAVFSEVQRAECNEQAEVLRKAGVATEVFFKSPKLGKQIDYASKKNIPYVLFVDEQSGVLQMKDIRSGEQEEVRDLKAWAGQLVE
ncbi:MAG: ATP phosphoribosyltransferase regulatory subunit, partial [Bdellovibrionales bacterium]|nr:ATP phosphoribosyltransferase regulatory subunit [Bdellovibrionales bacterium]